MQTPKVSFGAAQNLLRHTAKTSKKPVKILYGLKPMEDVSVSKLTLGVNKSIKFAQNVVKFAKNMFN